MQIQTSIFAFHNLSIGFTNGKRKDTSGFWRYPVKKKHIICIKQIICRTILQYARIFICKSLAYCKSIPPFCTGWQAALRRGSSCRSLTPRGAAVYREAPLQKPNAAGYGVLPPQSAGALLRRRIVPEETGFFDFIADPQGLKIEPAQTSTPPHATAAPARRPVVVPNSRRNTPAWKVFL